MILEIAGLHQCTSLDFLLGGALQMVPAAAILLMAFSAPPVSCRHRAEYAALGWCRQNGASLWPPIAMRLESAPTPARFSWREAASADGLRTAQGVASAAFMGSGCSGHPAAGYLRLLILKASAICPAWCLRPSTMSTFMLLPPSLLM